MDINTAAAAYMAAKEKERAAKKAAEAARAELIAAAGGRDVLTTDEYIITFTHKPRTIIDTVALYRDFPDLKNAYGRSSDSVSVDVKQYAADQQKTA